jgi:hypothetical protein
MSCILPEFNLFQPPIQVFAGFKIEDVGVFPFLADDFLQGAFDGCEADLAQCQQPQRFSIAFFDSALQR